MGTKKNEKIDMDVDAVAKKIADKNSIDMIDVLCAVGAKEAVENMQNVNWDKVSQELKEKNSATLKKNVESIKKDIVDNPAKYIERLGLELKKNMAEVRRLQVQLGFLHNNILSRLDDLSLRLEAIEPPL